ncbi:MAG: YgiQ family radical SAM protein [Gammaproteobacteria bacterium]|nr:YgiQ family radical SAM protein [Gammaproteobacteria bacterium]
MQAAIPLFSRHPYREMSPASVLPVSRAEMDALGWDACDVIIVCGDAYVDHPSFGLALIGRLLESQGFRVGIIAQPDWHSADAFKILGAPRLFFGVSAGNMDSMVNRYTADRKIRSDDAYTPGGEGGRRPDRAVIVYAQRCREAFPATPVVIGGIEASLRRIAHYDYWSETVRRSVLLDSKADLLLYGNAERQIIEVAHRVAVGEHPKNIQDLRGSVFVGKTIPADFVEIDSTLIEEPSNNSIKPDEHTIYFEHEARKKKLDTTKTVIRLPAYEDVKNDPVLYAHASRVLHMETNPGNARALVQRHGNRDLWVNSPPIPLTTAEMDRIYELPYSRLPHPVYRDQKIPAYEMIRFSVTIQRGCFGGCTFCSITEHEGRIIQNRSEQSILNEVETIRDKVPGFTGVISDLGGPTANMYRIACKSREIEALCRKPSCVYPDICENLHTDHSALVQLYRKARALPGIKKILIASGVRYDLAIKSPDYVKELVMHHVGGYLKIAPEHTEKGPLSKMMKPGIGAYYRFKELFDHYSKEAGKKQYLIPYFIAAHPGTTDEDMLQLAVWLKANGFRADQVQNFLPSPMALATAMYHSGKNVLRKVTRDSETVVVAKGLRARRLHKAFLRYHDVKNWPLLRDALKRMGRADLIGNSELHLIPGWQPIGTATGEPGVLKSKQKKPFLTQWTDLPKQQGKRKSQKRVIKKKSS